MLKIRSWNLTKYNFYFTIYHLRIAALQNLPMIPDTLFPSLPTTASKSGVASAGLWSTREPSLSFTIVVVVSISKLQKKKHPRLFQFVTLFIEATQSPEQCWNFSFFFSFLLFKSIIPYWLWFQKNILRHGHVLVLLQHNGFKSFMKSQIDFYDSTRLFLNSKSRHHRWVRKYLLKW